MTISRMSERGKVGQNSGGSPGGCTSSHTPELGEGFVLKPPVQEQERKSNHLMETQRKLIRVRSESSLESHQRRRGDLCQRTANFRNISRSLFPPPHINGRSTSKCT